MRVAEAKHQAQRFDHSAGEVVSGNEIANSEIAKWDPGFTKQLIGVVTPVIKRWFRAEVRGLESFPPAGGVLVVSNHSGGVLPPDWNILAPAFYDKFGYDRPLYTVAHYGVFITPFRGYLGRLGVIHASPETRRRRCTRVRWCSIFPAATMTRSGRR